MSGKLTNLPGDAFTLRNEVLRGFTEARDVFIRWPLRVALKPERLFLVSKTGTRTDLGLQN